MEAKQNWNLMRMKLYFPGIFSNIKHFDWLIRIVIKHDFENECGHQSRHLLCSGNHSSDFQFVSFTVPQRNKLSDFVQFLLHCSIHNKLI